MLAALPVLEDSFGRSIQYLRISVTDRCNLRCVYCMPEHGVPYESRADILTVGEILRLARLLAGYGLTKVRITGGEPLVRGREVVDLIREICVIPGISNVGLTTNAVLLADMADSLREAGLRRINISLDTLRPERFKAIARFAKFHDTQAGIDAAVRAGFEIKLNMVVMRGINDDECADLADLTRTVPFQVRFLEYMPIGQVTPWEWRAKYVPNDEVLSLVASRFELEPIATDCTSTARRFRIPGAAGTIGVISPMSHRFCSGCNRLRLTANGALVPCLSDNFEYDLRAPLRNGATDAELVEHVRAALAKKPLQSDFEGRVERGGSARIMAQIGG
jgi:cyclic pyranopterin phosphate synthase